MVFSGTPRNMSLPYLFVGFIPIVSLAWQSTGDLHASWQRTTTKTSGDLGCSRNSLCTSGARFLSDSSIHIHKLKLQAKIAAQGRELHPGKLKCGGNLPTHIWAPPRRPEWPAVYTYSNQAEHPANKQNEAVQAM